MVDVNLNLVADVRDDQMSGEPLFAFYYRCLASLPQVGGRDSLALGERPFSKLEQYPLDNFVQFFVIGLADPDLKREALRLSARTAGGLKAAYDRVLEAKKELTDRAKREKKEASDARVRWMEEFVRKTTGQTPQELIDSEQAGHPIAGVGSKGLHLGWRNLGDSPAIAKRWKQCFTDCELLDNSEIDESGVRSTHDLIIPLHITCNRNRIQIL